MKNIIAATDLSARSDRAVHRAAMEAHARRARLTLVSAVDDDLPAVAMKALAEVAKDSLKAQATELAAKYSGLTIKTRVVYGRHFEAILNAAGDAKADLIVLGQHRQGGMLDLFRGSTGERVARLGKQSVLVVADKPAKPYARIVLGVDFSPSSAAAAAFVCEQFKGAKVDMVYAFDMPLAGIVAGVNKGKRRTARDEAAIQALVESDRKVFLRSLPKAARGLPFHAEVGLPQDVVRAWVKKTKADLLVLGTHGRSGLMRAVLGSVAEGFLRQPPCDVLVVKN
jgi:universal stress protein E